MTVRIALDAMGGDNAPFAPVKGSLLPEAGDNIRLVLVGDRNKLAPLLPSQLPDYISILHCEKSIQMEDKVSLKLLREKENTMARVLDMLKEGRADCALSAGNTAAFTTLAISGLGVLPGVERPAIAVLLPTATGSFAVFVDVGGNINPKPLHLLQYGIMGSLYAERVFGVARPRIALLNIGEEPAKGDELRRETFRLLADQGSSLNFIGNLEGQELFAGKADVVVSDGFTGNVLLKVSEGITRSFRTILRKEMQKNLAGRIGSLLLKSHFRDFSRKANYADYGGGILLGVNGLVIISHGRSSPRAIASAIKLARKVAEVEFLGHLKERLNRTQ